MRIAVISDTHMPRGARALPSACIERLRRADLILHAGDLTGAAFLEELASLGPPVQAVAGNMDEPAVRRRLPEQRVVEAGGIRIGMVHVPGASTGRAGRLAAWFPGCGAVIYGHTHVAEVVRHGETWLLNPGSPTERRRSPARTMLCLTVNAGEIVPELVTLGPFALGPLTPDP
jgi:putative phosphoesterase